MRLIEKFTEEVLKNNGSFTIEIPRDDKDGNRTYHFIQDKIGKARYVYGISSCWDANFYSQLDTKPEVIAVVTEGKIYVDEVFHRQLMECEREEDKYFHEHDEYSILKKQFEEKYRQYGTTFGVSIVTGSCGVCVGNFENKREITIDELKDLLSKYAQLVDLIEKLTSETNIVY